MTPDDIVRALAAALPIAESERDRSTMCVLCDANTPIALTDHQPDCPWRMAAEYVGGSPLTPAP